MAKKRFVGQARSTIVNEASSAHSITASPRALQVLILEPNEKVASEIVSALAEAMPGTAHAVARSLGEAQQLLVDQKPALFVLDVDATYDLGQEFLYDLRTSHPEARAIILTAIHFTAQREQVAGLGAIHFLEKPFPRDDFVVLVEALLSPASKAEGERFQGTLSDLHIADIIQLKCISGATSMLEFTGPRGEKARVYFENGQVRHATAPGKEGRAAFDEIVNWKGGHISEVPVPHGTPHTINLEWQVLLMEAVRKIDEAGSANAPGPAKRAARKTAAQKILVIDDSAMLLSFVKEILTEHNYDVTTAATGEGGLRACHSNAPDLILLDYVLPDMKGDEVCRKLVADPTTAKVPVVYMSGLGSDLQPNRSEIPNVIGALSKPFTSESLIKAVRAYLPAGEGEAAERKMAEPEIAAPTESSAEEEKPRSIESEFSLDSLGEKDARPLDLPAAEPTPPPPAPEKARKETPADLAPPSTADSATSPSIEQLPPAAISAPAEAEPESKKLPDSTGSYFSGDSSFFSLHWALQTIAREKLTGTLRTFWARESIELLARDGRVVVVTTRDPNLYCAEAPVTLVNVERERIEAAREQQAQDGCPLFITLAKEGLILREPGLQLVQHYGQKLFSQLWTAERVRFVFKQEELPGYARDLPVAEDAIDQWSLSTLRFVQYQELGAKAVVEASSVPAYTRDGYERVQHLRLTAAEAQFASQFNGVRSIVQISKNLRLDLKFARLTLFRFLVLEIVECWPAEVAHKPESRGGLRGLFGR